MILLCIASAWADPIALRAPQGEVVVSVGLPDSSLGYWVTPAFGVSFDVHPRSTYGASVGWRQDVWRMDSGFGVELDLDGGLVMPFANPGFTLDASPAAQVGWAGKGLNAELGLAVPFVLEAAPDVEWRLPLLVEGWFGGRVKQVRLGAHLGMGTMRVSRAPSEVAYTFGIDIGVGAPAAPER